MERHKISQPHIYIALAQIYMSAQAPTDALYSSHTALCSNHTYQASQNIKLLFAVNKSLPSKMQSAITELNVVVQGPATISHVGVASPNIQPDLSASNFGIENIIFPLNLNNFIY